MRFLRLWGLICVPFRLWAETPSKNTQIKYIISNPYISEARTARKRYQSHDWFGSHTLDFDLVQLVERFNKPVASRSCLFLATVKETSDGSSSSKSTICCVSVRKALVQRRCASAGLHNTPAPHACHYWTLKPTACRHYNGSLSCSECEKALYWKRGRKRVQKSIYSLLKQKFSETRCLTLRKIVNLKSSN